MEAAKQQDSEAAIRDIRRRYYVVWSVYAVAGGFLFGVYPLFLRSRGLNQLQINSVLAVYLVVIFLTDVPTGAFADAIGRRKSFLLGCALRFIGFLAYYFVHSYAMFVLAEIIDGVGTTFCNGAIDAWGVDALDRAGYIGLKDRLFSRLAQLMHVGWMVSAVVGAYIADFDIAVPWLLGAAGYFASAIVGGMLMHEEKAPHAEMHFSKLPAEVTRRIVGGLRQGFDRRPVLLLSTANALAFAAWSPYWLQWPQLVNDDYAVGMWVVGWAYGILTIAHLIGAEVVARREALQERRGIRLSGLVLAASTFMFAAGLSARAPSLMMVFLFMMNVCTGAMQPLMQTWFNEQIGAGERATLLSFSSTFSTLGGSVGSLAGGYLADLFGISFTWLVLAAVLLGAAPCYWSLRPRTGPVAAVSNAAD